MKKTTSYNRHHLERDLNLLSSKFQDLFWNHVEAYLDTQRFSCKTHSYKWTRVCLLDRGVQEAIEKRNIDDLAFCLCNNCLDVFRICYNSVLEELKTE